MSARNANAFGLDRDVIKFGGHSWVDPMQTEHALQDTVNTRSSTV